MSGNESAFPQLGIETDLVGDGSGAKFPHTYSYETGAGSGLTKRELFAAMAPAEEIERIRPATVGETATYVGHPGDLWRERNTIEAIAKARVAWADAMLAALHPKDVVR